MTGTQIIVPLLGLFMPFEMICLTISTPLTSSPCMPAVIRTVGPAFLERSIIIGTSIEFWVCSFATLKLNVALFPGSIFSPKIFNTFFYFMLNFYYAL